MLQYSNCDNSNLDKMLFLKKSVLLRTSWALDNQWYVLGGAFCDIAMFLIYLWRTETRPFGSIRCILDNCSYNPKRFCENSWHFLSNLFCHDIWSKHVISNMGCIIYSSSNFMLETGLCYPNYLSDYLPPLSQPPSPSPPSQPQSPPPPPTVVSGPIWTNLVQN